MNNRRLITLFISFLTVLTAQGDQGMWLPTQLKKGVHTNMRKNGLRLPVDALYNAEKPSLNDAIVQFDGGCTGEVISPEGLLLTNHHCGYDQIQAHSSVEHDYLTNGFVAANRAQELPNPNLVVSFMRKMEDVTQQIAAGQHPDSIINQAIRGTHYRATINQAFYGAESYLYVYEDFQDVRLVFAPPSSIGKFGGDTDNWMWPRHTGDFSIFRIYTAPDGKPAKYSPQNIPYLTPKFLRVELEGVSDNDFVFVYGYPGRTQQYLHSQAVNHIVERSNPEKIALRTIRLDQMNRAADTSDKIRIQYAAKNANVANAWKKWQGELLGLKRLKTVQRKQNEEAVFEAWAKGKKYEGITLKIAELYDQLNPLLFARDMYNEGAMGSEMLKFLATEPSKRDSINFFKDYNVELDSLVSAKLFAKIAQLLPPEQLPQGFCSNSKPTQELADAFNKLLENDYYKALNSQLDSLYAIYVEGVRVRRPMKIFYPDANFTLRIAYGHVTGYQPSDGVYFKPFSTVQGIIEKDRPEIYDYNLPEKLRQIAPDNKNVPVAFISTAHTTGGNSGSPVLNADGKLVGLNFDRVWQGTMSDIEFDSAMCRNIALDVRYILFIVDKFAGARHLVDEITTP